MSKMEFENTVLYRKLYISKGHKRSRKLEDEIYKKKHESICYSDLVDLFVMLRMHGGDRSTTMEYKTNLDVDTFFCLVDRVEGTCEEEVFVQVPHKHIQDVYGRWENRCFERKELSFGGFEDFFQFHEDVETVLEEEALY